MAALYPCVACENPVGRKVRRCPQCGTKQPRRFGLGTVLVLLPVGAFFFLVMAQPEPPAPTAEQIEARELASADRQRLLENALIELAATGVIRLPVRRGGKTLIEVNPLFYAFDARQREAVARTAFERYQLAVVLRDAQSGREIASYSRFGGMSFR